MTIEIRPYRKDDVEELYNLVIASSSHLKPWMPWCHSDYSIDDTRAWVEQSVSEWEEKKAFRYLIEDSETSEICGAVGIERIVWVHKVAELGYWVGANAINAGVATAAARLATIEAFTEHGLRRIEVNVLTDNIASNKVAHKLGAVYEGAFRNKLYHNGKSNSAKCYSLIPLDLNIQ